MTVRADPRAILIVLDSLMAPRADPPAPLEGARVALRRIGYVGRPVVLAGRRVGERELPGSDAERVAWVRATLGSGGYRVVVPEEAGDPPMERWQALRDELGAVWLVTDRLSDVMPARTAGLSVILIGQADVQRPALRPTYQARDLRDAVGHLLVADVFADASPRVAAGIREGQA